MLLREQRCTVKNRVRELRSPGTVRDEGSNVLVYSEIFDLGWTDRGAVVPPDNASRAPMRLLLPDYAATEARIST